MAFRVKGLAPDSFKQFYAMPDNELAALNIMRHRVDAFPGVPDRVTMQDLQPGETALLLNFEHLPVASPYRSCHAIYVKEGAEAAYDGIDEIPDVMTRRMLSLRGIDRDGLIVDADLAEGEGIEPMIRSLFENDRIAYIHAHYAKRGCFAGLIERA